MKLIVFLWFFAVCLTLSVQKKSPENSKTIPVLNSKDEVEYYLVKDNSNSGQNSLIHTIPSPK